MDEWEGRTVMFLVANSRFGAIPLKKPGLK
jgi:hypothetical protein